MQREKEKTFMDADWVLNTMGWTLWLMAALIFLGHLPALSIAERCCTTLMLFGGGIMCSSLSLASPKGSWSFWRRTWYDSWTVYWWVILTMSLLTSVVDSQSERLRYFGSNRNLCVITTMSGAMAYFTTWYRPVGDPIAPAKVTTCPCSALATNLYMALCCGIAATSLIDVYASAPERSLSLWLCALLVVGTTFHWAVSSLCARTDAELIAIISPGVFMLAAAACKFWMYQNYSGVGVMALGLAGHCLLYRDTSDESTETRNPFHESLRRWIKGVSNILQDPVSGFGDDS